MANPIGEEINELYEWCRYNGFKLDNRQKNELKTILKSAVNKRTQDLQVRLQKANERTSR